MEILETAADYLRNCVLAALLALLILTTASKAVADPPGASSSRYYNNAGTANNTSPASNAATPVAPAPVATNSMTVKSDGTYGDHGYKPLTAGPPTQSGISTAWPARKGRNSKTPAADASTSSSPLLSPNQAAPNQANQAAPVVQSSGQQNAFAQPAPDKPYADRGKDIDKSVLDSAWKKARQRDSQGLPGSPIANPNERPPVPEDKPNMTPLEKSKLAYWYWKTERVSKLPRAVQLMTEAAEAGDSRSQAVLADWYTRGIRDTLQVDDAKAFYWNTKAAIAGQRVAQLALADNYYNGLVVPKNYNTAFSWYMKSAQQNFPAAEFAVGQAYCCGEGVGENRSEALKWFNKSKADGCTSAQNFLQVLSLPNCPTHFSSLNELLTFGQNYELREAYKQRLQSQASIGQNKMMTSQFGSQQHREGSQLYQRAQQGLNNLNR